MHNAVSCSVALLSLQGADTSVDCSVLLFACSVSTRVWLQPFAVHFQCIYTGVHCSVSLLTGSASTQDLIVVMCSVQLQCVCAGVCGRHSGCWGHYDCPGLGTDPAQHQATYHNQSAQPALSPTPAATCADMQHACTTASYHLHDLLCWLLTRSLVSWQ